MVRGEKKRAKRATNQAVGTYRTMSFEDKQEFIFELKDLSTRMMMGDLGPVFRKFGWPSHNKDIYAYVDKADDESLWGLRREIRALVEAKYGKKKLGPRNTVQKGMTWSNASTLWRLTCNRSTCAPADQSQSVNSTQAKCSSCGSLTCHCRLKNSSAHESISGRTSLNVEMSPKKALRAAMLKRRFADIIFKAAHQVDKCDPLKMQQDRERLEREKQQEKAKVEAEIKAGKAASHTRERAAARIALQKMKKTVEIYENIDISKDLEMLRCGFLYEVQGVHRGSPLERLGLYLKDDYLDED